MQKINRMLWCVALAIGVSSCRSVDPALTADGTSRLQGVYDDRYLLRLTQTQSGTSLYLFEVCLRTAGRQEVTGCVPAFLSEKKKNVLFSIRALNTHYLSSDSLEALSQLDRSWKSYKTALQRSPERQLGAGGLVVGGGAVVINRDKIFFNFSEEGSEEMRKLLRQNKLPQVIPDAVSVNAREHVLADDFVEFVQQHLGDINHLNTPLLRRARGTRNMSFSQLKQLEADLKREAKRMRARNVKLQELTRQYLGRGHKVQDLIHPEFWQRYIQYYAAEAGEVAAEAHMVKYFRRDPYRTLRHAYSFVKNKGVSPRLKQMVTQAYPKLATGVDLSKAVRNFRQKPLLGQKSKIVRGVVIVTAVLSAAVTYVLTHAHAQESQASQDLDDVVATAEQEVDQDFLLQHSHLPVVLDGWEDLTSTDPEHHARTSSVRDDTQALGRYLRLLLKPQQEQNTSIEDLPLPYSFCLPTSSAAGFSPQCSPLEAPAL